MYNMNIELLNMNHSIQRSTYESTSGMWWIKWVLPLSNVNALRGCVLNNPEGQVNIPQLLQ